jgi:hypothetical protein
MFMLIALYLLQGVSSQAHERVLSFLMGTASFRFCFGLCEVLPQPLEAQRSPLFPGDPGIMPQRPDEGTFALGACETFGRGVQMRPATGCCAARVGYDEPGTVLGLRVRPCDHPQQLTLGGSFPASDAGADWSAAASRSVEL